MSAAKAQKDAMRAVAMERRREAMRANPSAGARLAIHSEQLEFTNIVGAYVPIRSEIDPMPLAGAMIMRGARLALPAVEGRDMVFRLFDPSDDLVPGPFGLMQPDDTRPLVVPDLVLTPLLAFDREGFRLGYGAGHFDRWFAQNGPVRTAGLAFAAQEVASVPREPHDVPLRWIFTELECITGSGSCV